VLDLGGVVELYPSRRVIIRFDVGDTVRRIGNQNLPLFSSRETSTRHSLQFSTGVGLRF
jgi:hypothetical protein